MFERFTSSAREVVVRAQSEARELGHGWLGTEHLLLGVVGGPDSRLAGVLLELGVSHDGVRREVARRNAEGLDDHSALRGLGIDLDDVRRRVEDQFGPGALSGDDSARTFHSRWRRVWRRSGAGAGHIPFSGNAKKALELSLREAVALHSQDIGAEHVLLGILRAGGTATDILHRLEVSTAVVRHRVQDLLRNAA